MVSRYRDERADGVDREDAVITAMVLFPIHFLKSFADAGVATVGFAALGDVAGPPAPADWRA